MRKSTGLVATITRTAPVGPIIAGLQRPQHQSQCRSVGSGRDPNDSALHDNLDHRLTNWPAGGLRRVRGDNNRGKGERMIDRLALGLTTPGEQVLGRHAVTARHLRHDRTRGHCLLQDPRLLVRRPASASANSGDHFQTPHRPRRLKHMVNHQHKTIPNQRSSVSLLRHANVRCGENTAYIECTRSRNSGNPDGLRAPKREHLVQGMNGDGNLRRTTPIRPRAQPVAD